MRTPSTTLLWSVLCTVTYTTVSPPSEGDASSPATYLSGSEHSTHRDNLQQPYKQTTTIYPLVPIRSPYSVTDKANPQNLRNKPNHLNPDIKEINPSQPWIKPCNWEKWSREKKTGVWYLSGRIVQRNHRSRQGMESAGDQSSGECTLSSTVRSKVEKISWNGLLLSH